MSDKYDADYEDEEEYEDDYDDPESEFDARRLARHKRRVRNQVLAYIVLFLLIAGLGFGIYKGASFAIGYFKNRQPQTLPGPSVNEATVSDDTPGVIMTPDAISEDSVSEDTVSEDEATVADAVPENPEARAYIDNMTLEQKVAGLFIVSPEALTGVTTATAAGDGTKAALEKYAVGGIIYSGKNITGADQFKGMTANTQDFYNQLYNTDVFLAVREEGAVNILAGSAAGVTAVTGASATESSDDAYTSYLTVGNYLDEYGLNMDIAPVCDVKITDGSYIGDRSFGDDAASVSDMITSSVGALCEMGISPCIVSFPGYGDVTGNPANGAVSTERTKEEMEQCEFLPFKAGIDAGADAVLVSHLQAPNVTGDDLPASLSSVMITDILRGELGFNGIVITDSMNMAAITGSYTAGDAAVMAIQAGADMILEPADFAGAYNAVLDAVNNGTLTEERIDESLMRIYSVKFGD